MIEMVDCAWVNPLEQTGDDEAVGIKPCGYPDCEECDKYVLNKDGAFCTVPIVVSKQMYHLASAELRRLQNQISEIEQVLTSMLFLQPEETEETVENNVSYGLPDDE